MTSFSIERFANNVIQRMSEVDDRLAAAKSELTYAMQHHGLSDIRQALEEAVPAGASIGEMIVFHAPELTMLYARAPARFQSGIHDHTVSACMGQLVGQERSIIYRQVSGGLEVAETLAIVAGEVMTLPDDVIHHIENPCDETSCALHLYLGDFGALQSKRSLWTHDDHERVGFSFPELLKQSVGAMQDSGNTQGLQAVMQAVPAARALVGQV